MKKKKWHKTKHRRRIWAVNARARAVPWSVGQGELWVQALAVTLGREGAAGPPHQHCCDAGRDLHQPSGFQVG